MHFYPPPPPPPSLPTHTHTHTELAMLRSALLQINEQMAFVSSRLASGSKGGLAATMQAIKNILLLLFNGKILILLMTMQAAEEQQFNNITIAVIWLKLTVAKERQFNITNNVLLLFNVSTNNLLLTNILISCTNITHNNDAGSKRTTILFPPSIRSLHWGVWCQGCGKNKFEKPTYTQHIYTLSRARSLSLSLSLTHTHTHNRYSHSDQQ